MKNKKDMKKENIILGIFIGIGFILLVVTMFYFMKNIKCEILIGKVKSVFYDSGWGSHYWTGEVIDQYGRSHIYTIKEPVSVGDEIISKSFGCGGAINQPF